MQRRYLTIRRAALVPLTLLAAVVVAGCGSSSSSTGLPALGQWQNGRLEASDLKDADGWPYDVHRIRIEEAGRYRITVRDHAEGPDFTPVIGLRLVSAAARATQPTTRALAANQLQGVQVTVLETDLDEGEYELQVAAKKGFISSNYPPLSPSYSYLIIRPGDSKPGGW